MRTTIHKEDYSTSSAQRTSYYDSHPEPIERLSQLINKL